MISIEIMSKSKAYLSLALLLAGCMSVKVDSVKAPDFDGKLTRLYINLKSSG
jgi:hypothetical protein